MQASSCLTSTHLMRVTIGAGSVSEGQLSPDLTDPNDAATILLVRSSRRAMPPAELLLSFGSLEAARAEYEANLRHGRAFVPGAGGLELYAPCRLRISRDDGVVSLEIEARVIMVSDREPMRGTAVELVDGSWRERLAHWLEPITADPGAPVEDDVEQEAAPPPPGSLDRHRHLRGLSPVERAKIAQGMNLEERVAIERIYGNAVWEALLRCPHVTIPEVARIARKGALPRPLADVITDNANWVRQDLIRRALLTNPRLSPEGLTKVLRATPQRELKLIQHQTAYTPQVRAFARKLLGG